jgi:hypothetical protein
VEQLVIRILLGNIPRFPRVFPTAAT